VKFFTPISCLVGTQSACSLFPFNPNVSNSETDSLAKTLLLCVIFSPDTALTGTTVQCIVQRILSLLQPAALLSEVRQLHALLNSAASFSSVFIHLFFRSFIMKSIRIVAIAVLATTAMSAFAANDTGDRFEPTAQSSVSSSSTLSRAQVQAEAVKANHENFKRFNSGERSDFSLSTSVAAPSNGGLTREAVRSEVIKARSTAIVVDSSS
jgi:hypothetical protein